MTDDIEELIDWLKAYANVVDCIDPEVPSRAAANLCKSADNLEALKAEIAKLSGALSHSHTTARANLQEAMNHSQRAQKAEAEIVRLREAYDDLVLRERRRPLAEPGS